MSYFSIDRSIQNLGSLTEVSGTIDLIRYSINIHNFSKEESSLLFAKLELVFLQKFILKASLKIVHLISIVTRIFSLSQCCSKSLSLSVSHSHALTLFLLS